MADGEDRKPGNPYHWNKPKDDGGRRTSETVTPPLHRRVNEIRGNPAPWSAGVPVPVMMPNPWGNVVRPSEATGQSLIHVYTVSETNTPRPITVPSVRPRLVYEETPRRGGGRRRGEAAGRTLLRANREWNPAAGEQRSGPRITAKQLRKTIEHLNGLNKITTEGLAHLLDATIIPEPENSSESGASQSDEVRAANKAIDLLKKEHATELNDLTEKNAELQEQVSELKEQLKGANRLYKIELQNATRLRTTRDELEGLLHMKTEQTETDTMRLRADLRLAEDLKRAAEADNEEYELKVEDLHRGIAVRDAMIKCITEKYEKWGQGDKPKLSKLTLTEAESLRTSALQGMKGGPGPDLSPTMKETLKKHDKLLEKDFMDDDVQWNHRHSNPAHPKHHQSQEAQSAHGAFQQQYMQYVAPDGTTITTALPNTSAAPNKAPTNKRHRSKSPEEAEHNPAENPAGIEEGHLAETLIEDYIAAAITAAERDPSDPGKAGSTSAQEQKTTETALAVANPGANGTEIEGNQTEETVEVTIEPAVETVVEIVVGPPAGAPDDEKVGDDAPPKN